MLNNGDEIKLFNSVEELKKYYDQPKRLGGDHVIQQYLPNPDLIDGRKYTFRIHAVLTNYAGVFLYKQGYVNISALPFDLHDNFANRKAHLTNYVIDGEFAHVKQRSTQTLVDFERSYQQMSQIVIKVIKGLLTQHPLYLAPNKTKKFEIFGFDFIKDDKGKVWLLEINQSPDAPTFEANTLDPVLWQPFWQDILNEFVLPIALNTPPKNGYTHYLQLLKPNECYSKWRYFWAQLKK
jgi:tubulin--tyrosine ligase